MFLGEYECVLDNKRRLFIPATFRKDLSFIVLTVIDDDTLVLMDKDGWNPESVLEDASISKEKMKMMVRYIKANSYSIKIDSQGRIVIPNDIFSRLSISRDVMCVGNIDKILVLSKSKYLEEKDIYLKQYREFMESEEGRDFRQSLVFRKN